MFDPRCIYLSSHVKKPILRIYFCVPSFRADKRARIIIEGYLAAFPTSVEPYLYTIGEANFDPNFVVHKDIKLRSRSLFAELARFEMISKPKSLHYLRFAKCGGKRLARNGQQ